MMAKRIVLLIAVFSMLFTASVFADSLWGSYEGYSKARVRINNSDVQTPDGGVPGFLINGSTVLPLRQVANSLQAIVKWDDSTKTADLYKPDVHMFIAQDVTGKDLNLMKPFGKVTQGLTQNFVVFPQVDNLKVKVDGFRITIEDPNGQLVTEPVEVPIAKQDDTFWYPWPFKVNFSQKGNYTVKFAFLVDDEYTVVSQKLIVSE